MTTADLVRQDHPLVGRWFQTVAENGRIYWRGQIIASCGDGYFLVQLFEWLFGMPDEQHVVHIRDIAANWSDGTPRFTLFAVREHEQEHFEGHWRPHEDIPSVA